MFYGNTVVLIVQHFETIFSGNLLFNLLNFQVNQPLERSRVSF